MRVSKFQKCSNLKTTANFPVSCEILQIKESVKQCHAMCAWISWMIKVNTFFSKHICTWWHYVRHWLMTVSDTTLSVFFRQTADTDWELTETESLTLHWAHTCFHRFAACAVYDLIGLKCCQPLVKWMTAEFRGDQTQIVFFMYYRCGCFCAVYFVLHCAGFF